MIYGKRLFSKKLARCVSMSKKNKKIKYLINTNRIAYQKTKTEPFYL